VTQLSSFDKATVLKHGGAFKSNGLDIKDYIVETKVPMLTFADLKNKVAAGTLVPLMLIDTEGLDCKVSER